MVTDRVSAGQAASAKPGLRAAVAPNRPCLMLVMSNSQAMKLPFAAFHGEVIDPSLGRLAQW
jgi:hypothetical protein